MRLTAPQSEFFASKAKATALVSGFGAGKTVSAITRILATKLTYPSIDLLYAAPTYPLIRDILYPEFEDIASNSNIPFKINRSDNDIIIPGHGKILCRTLDKPERLVGFKVGDAFLDELDVLDTDKALHVWRKVIARARAKFPDGKPNQLWVTTTPEGFKATYQLFKKSPPENYKLIKASTRSNPYLPPDYVDSLISAYPDHLIKAYINGDFVNLSAGTVYKSFNHNTNKSTYLPRPREKLFIGIDFNAYNMHAIVHVIRNGHAHAVDEFTGLDDTPATLAAISTKYPEHPITFYPDSTGIKHNSTNANQTDIALLKNAGHAVSTNPTNPAVTDRVNSFNAALLDSDNNSFYFVNTKRCPVLTESLENQAYDDNGKPDKKTGYDHAVDAAGYFVYKWRPLKRKNTYREAGNWK